MAIKCANQKRNVYFRHCFMWRLLAFSLYKCRRLLSYNNSYNPLREKTRCWDNSWRRRKLSWLRCRRPSRESNRRLLSYNNSYNPARERARCWDNSWRQRKLSWLECRRPSRESNRRKDNWYIHVHAYLLRSDYPEISLSHIPFPGHIVCLSVYMCVCICMYVCVCVGRSAGQGQRASSGTEAGETTDSLYHFFTYYYVRSHDQHNI